MSDNLPIINDINQASMLANLNNSTYSVLTEQANKGRTLLHSITSNSNFTGIVNNFSVIYTGYKDRQDFETGRTYIAQFAAGVLGVNYGRTDNYWGNLKGLEWYSALPTPSTLTYDVMIGSASPPGPSGVIGIRIGGVNSTYPVSAIEFMADQFEFINKYLWANPTNPSLSAVLTDNTMKYGIQYNATTLKQVASAHEDSKTFYRNKVNYLTPLIQ
jgi:hypothetical protein